VPCGEGNFQEIKEEIIRKNDIELLRWLMDNKDKLSDQRAELFDRNDVSKSCL
jgi:hypothetical protein